MSNIFQYERNNSRIEGGIHINSVYFVFIEVSLYKFLFTFSNFLCLLSYLMLYIFQIYKLTPTTQTIPIITNASPNNIHSENYHPGQFPSKTFLTLDNFKFSTGEVAWGRIFRLGLQDSTSEFWIQAGSQEATLFSLKLPLLGNF